jgi:hypothetical protein
MFGTTSIVIVTRGQQGKLDEALAVADQLLGGGSLRSEGMILRSQVFTARGDTPAARRELEHAVAEFANDLEPLQAFCRADRSVNVCRIPQFDSRQRYT